VGEAMCRWNTDKYCNSSVMSVCYRSVSRCALRSLCNCGQRNIKMPIRRHQSDSFFSATLSAYCYVVTSLRGQPVCRNRGAFARDRKGRRFKSRPVHFQVTTLGKLLTPMSLCHALGNGLWAVTLFGWEGNRRLCRKQWQPTARWMA